MKRASGLLILALSGCFGFDERVAACERGELGCVKPLGACLVAGDLLNNGSFERPGSAGAFAGWNAAPALISHQGDAASCDFWAEHTSRPGDDPFLENPFDLSAAAPAGTMFELGASLRSLDGNLQPLVFQLRVRNGGYEPKRTGRLNADGSWTEVSVELPLSSDSSELSLEILPEEPRSFGIDRVFVRRR